MTTKPSPVEQAARKWWRSRRPIGWTLTEHIRQFQVNTVSTAERLLAREVARSYMRNRKLPKPQEQK